MTSGLGERLSRHVLGAFLLTGALLGSGCDDDDVPFYGNDAAAGVGGSGGSGGVDAAAGTGGVGGTGAGDAGVPDAAATVGDGGPVGGAGGATFVDTDMAVVRINADGTIDNGFGTSGIARINLGAGASASARDFMYGLDRDAQNRPVIFGMRKAATRSDTDRVVVRLTTAGALDEGFADKGVYTLDIAGLNDNQRNGFVQADGKILSAGYTAQPTGVGTQSANRIVLLRLDGDGKPDKDFGVKGIVNSNPLTPADPVNQEWGMAEAYAAGAQSTGAYVTTGYGRAAAMGTVDIVSFRYSATGMFDGTFGMSGRSILDLVMLDDRGRNLIVLGDDRVLIAGSGTKAMSSIDALVAILQPNGLPDATFDGDGYKLYDFGRADEAFWGVALNPAKNTVALAGYRAGGTGANDDATLAIVPVAAGGAAEFQGAVPLSADANDRFWAAAFDASGKVIAVGFVNEGGDNLTAVARYNTNGTLDTTFGGTGVVKVNVSVAGTDEAARAVAVGSDGKILVGVVAEQK